MKGKGLKRFMGTFLSCALALSTMAFAPMTVNAEGGMLAEAVDCTTGFAPSKSPLITVTAEAQTYVFTSTSNPGATLNWEAPIFFVYSAPEAIPENELFIGCTGNSYL